MSEMNAEDGWLVEVISLAKSDLPSATRMVADSRLPPEEKEGVQMAVRGISALEALPEQDRVLPSMNLLSKLEGGVLLGALDGAYIKTWLLYAKGLGGVEEKGGVKREDHEPEEEEGPPPLGVQLSLTAYGAADEGSSDDDAQEVKEDQ